MYIGIFTIWFWEMRFLSSISGFNASIEDKMTSLLSAIKERDSLGWTAVENGGPILLDGWNLDHLTRENEIGILDLAIQLFQGGERDAIGLYDGIEVVSCGNLAMLCSDLDDLADDNHIWICNVLHCENHRQINTIAFGNGEHCVAGFD